MAVIISDPLLRRDKNPSAGSGSVPIIEKKKPRLLVSVKKKKTHSKFGGVRRISQTRRPAVTSTAHGH